MNSILIVSDSHGWTEELSVIRQRHHDVDIAIHCGDSELDEHNPYLSDYRSVKGNCDYGNFSDEIICEHGGLTIFVTHGHLFDCKSSLMKLAYRAEEVDADIVCFGHSHVAYAEQFDKHLFINPGSIRLPRYFPEKSYALLKWEHPKNLKLVFFDLNGNRLTSLPYANQFSLE